MGDTATSDGAGLRLVLIGAGWITPAHLRALDRLGRTRLVGVASARLENAASIAEPRGAAAYVVSDLEPMLDRLRPDLAYICIPPAVAPGIVATFVARRIPFLTEKPLAATDGHAPARIARDIAAVGLVAAVGYHLRGLAGLDDVRGLLARNPAHLVSARWLSSTPGPAWWRRESLGGGQVIEQATHFYDLARCLVGEATVIGAASMRQEPVVPEGADVVDATAAVLHFANGAVGSFANTRRLASSAVEIEFAASDLSVSIRRTSDDPGGWTITIDDGTGPRALPSGRDPYEVQAEAFLDAVEARDPSRVLSTYADALLTDRLTRAVVAATGRPG